MANISIIANFSIFEKPIKQAITQEKYEKQCP